MNRIVFFFLMLFLVSVAFGLILRRRGTWSNRGPIDGRIKRGQDQAQMVLGRG